MAQTFNMKNRTFKTETCDRWAPTQRTRREELLALKMGLAQ